MIRSLFLLALCAALASFPATHPYKIKGCLEGNTASQVYLAQICGSKTTVVDTSLVTNGCFDFYLSDSTRPGMYSIILDKERDAYIRVLFNRENIVFRAQRGHLLDTIAFTESRENQLQYEHARFLARSNETLALLQKLTGFYDRKDDFHDRCQKEMDRVTDRLSKEPAAMIARDPTTLFARLLRAQQPVAMPARLDETRRAEYYRQHYLDNIDLADTALVRTDILPPIIRQYLTFFEEKDLTQVEQEERYKEGVDRLLAKCTGNAEVADLVIRELLDVFRYGDYDIMGAYVTERYLAANRCESELDKQGQATTIAGIKRVAVGKKAPEIMWPDSSGVKPLLSSIKEDYVLLVFWSTRCAFCTRMLPELRDLYAGCHAKSFEILGYSLDTDRQRWKEFQAAGDYKWMSYVDSLGWRSNVVRDYNVTGTPMLFLLNRERKIIAKPVDLAGLRDKLKALAILP